MPFGMEWRRFLGASRLHARKGIFGTTKKTYHIFLIPDKDFYYFQNCKGRSNLKAA